MQMNHRISAGALVVHKNSILLVRHCRPERYDFWVAPGGGVVGSENIYAATKREAFEETGLHVKPIRLAYIEEFYSPDTRYCKFWLYCEYLSGELSVEAPEAQREYIVDAQFMSKGTLQNKTIFPDVLYGQFWQDWEDGFSTPKYLGLRKMEFY